MAHSIPPYGVAIHDAIASGDVGQMQKTAADAESYLKEYGDIGTGLRKLYAEIERLGGDARPTPMPMYGVVMRAAIESEDPVRMKALVQHAEDFLKDADEKDAEDVRSALDELKKAIG